MEGTQHGPSLRPSGPGRRRGHAENRPLGQDRKEQRLARIRIHTVGVGAHDKNFMKSLAEDHGGTYIAQ